jgi:RimJ/RimL family protein N-acetyltransferase
MIVRTIHQNDLLDIFLWRNDLTSIFYSIKNKKITFLQHVNWFRKSLINPNIKIYIGLIRKYKKLSKIGIVRFDIKKKIVIVSINLNPDFRGKKFSSQFLKLSIKKFLIYKKKNLKAIIRNNNIPSIKCFLKNGFILFIKDKEFSVYKKFLN